MGSSSKRLTDSGGQSRNTFTISMPKPPIFDFRSCDPRTVLYPDTSPESEKGFYFSSDEENDIDEASDHDHPSHRFTTAPKLRNLCASFQNDCSCTSRTKTTEEWKPFPESLTYTSLGPYFDNNTQAVAEETNSSEKGIIHNNSGMGPETLLSNTTAASTNRVPIIRLQENPTKYDTFFGESEYVRPTFGGCDYQRSHSIDPSTAYKFEAPRRSKSSGTPAQRDDPAILDTEYWGTGFREVPKCSISIPSEDSRGPSKKDSPLPAFDRISYLGTVSRSRNGGLESVVVETESIQNRMGSPRETLSLLHQQMSSRTSNRSSSEESIWGNHLNVVNRPRKCSRDAVKRELRYKSEEVLAPVDVNRMS
jgi:hypothetical protein